MYIHSNFAGAKLAASKWAGGLFHFRVLGFFTAVCPGQAQLEAIKNARGSGAAGGDTLLAPPRERRSIIVSSASSV